MQQFLKRNWLVLLGVLFALGLAGYAAVATSVLSSQVEVVCPPGPAGETGTTGETGATGPQGEPGEAGATGAQGEVGPQGTCGPQGTSGPQGPEGPQGIQGLQGLQGIAGPAGSTGAQGPAGPTGPAGPAGATGPAGPAGGFGAYGSFYDTADLALPAATPTPVRLNTTQFSSGVSIFGTNKITFAQAGRYNIAFSSQLKSAAAQRRNITIWLSKNGTAQANWMPETSTDVILGTSVEDEKAVAAWNFFVDAAAGDYYVLMIVSSGTNVSLDGGVSLNGGLGLPEIPSTILTVNQVG